MVKKEFEELPQAEVLRLEDMVAHSMKVHFGDKSKKTNSLAAMALTDANDAEMAPHQVVPVGSSSPGVSVLS